MDLRQLAEAGVTLDALVAEVIERAEQRVRLTLKWQEVSWSSETDARYRDGFESACELIEKGLAEHVRRHLDGDLLRLATKGDQP